MTQADWATRNAHIATIKSMQADIDENMNGYSFFALDERAKKLQSDWHKIEGKNLKITGTENGVEFNMEDFSNENRQLDNLVMDLKAKIRERMASLEHEKKMAGIELNQDAIGNGNENTNAGDM